MAGLGLGLVGLGYGGGGALLTATPLARDLRFIISTAPKARFNTVAP
jgi:hypothetical protein